MSLIGLELGNRIGTHRRARRARRRLAPIGVGAAVASGII
jgi:hypothetical protein